MTDSNEPALPQSPPTEAGNSLDRPLGSPRRVGRRRLVKAATATAAGIVAASGYVRPSVRPLQTPVAHAFSF